MPVDLILKDIYLTKENNPQGGHIQINEESSEVIFSNAIGRVYLRLSYTQWDTLTGAIRGFRDSIEEQSMNDE